MVKMRVRIDTSQFLGFMHVFNIYHSRNSLLVIICQVSVNKELSVYLYLCLPILFSSHNKRRNIRVIYNIYVYIYIYMYVCVCVCVCVRVYIYIYIYI